MKKPWVYKRKNIKGWWVGWHEGSKRKAKALPNKALAEHFRHIKYTQLNSDVFTSIVDFDWQQMIEEYRQCKQVEGLVDASIYEVLLTLRHFKRIVAPIHPGKSHSRGWIRSFSNGVKRSGKTP